jgi:hypothetical protein
MARPSSLTGATKEASPLGWNSDQGTTLSASIDSGLAMYRPPQVDLLPCYRGSYDSSRGGLRVAGKSFKEVSRSDGRGNSL